MQVGIESLDRWEVVVFISSGESDPRPRSRAWWMTSQNFALVLAISMIAGAGLEWTDRARGQEIRVEDRVPEGLAQDKAVVIAAERLRQLRMSESKLGERHPSLQSIRGQISSLETELEERLEKYKAEPQKEGAGDESKPTESRPVAGLSWEAGGMESFGGVSNRLDLVRDLIETEERAVVATAWSARLRRAWGERLGRSMVRTREPYRLVEAYPHLRFRDLKLVGPFPAFGLMWGIENSADGDFGCVWQWRDDPQSRHRVAVLEVAKTVTGVVFAEDFQESGRMFVVTASPEPGGGVYRNEVWQYRLEPLPPFALVSDRAELIASGTSQGLDIGNLHRISGDELVLELGEGSTLMGATKASSAFEIRVGTWKIVVAGFGGSEEGETLQQSAAVGEAAISGGGDGEGLGTGEPRLGADASGASASHWVIDVGKNEVLLKDLLGYRENVQLGELLLQRHVIGGIAGAEPNGEQVDPEEARWIVVDGFSGEVLRSPGRGGIAMAGGGEVLARTSRRLVGVGMDPHGMPMPIDEDDVVLRLELQPSARESFEMPSTLGGSGWYVSTQGGVLESAFAPVVVGGAGLGVGLRHDTWVCVPEGKGIDVSNSNAWEYPEGTLILQTISRSEGVGASGVEASESAVGRRLETQVLLRVDRAWRPYRYVWGAMQQDAVLAETVEEESVALEAGSIGKADSPVGQERCYGCHLPQGRRFLIGFESRCLDEGIAGKRRLLESLVQRGALMDLRGASVREGAVLDAGRAELLSAPFDQLKRSAVDPVGLDVSAMSARLNRDHLNHWLAAARRPSGYFSTRLDRSWEPITESMGNLTTQSQMLYCLASGHRMKPESSLEQAILQGGKFLLKHFSDTQSGGFFWAVDGAGRLVDSRKSLRGNAYAILGLVAAGRTTGRREFIEAATRCWGELRTKMMNPSGGYFAVAAHDFSQAEGCSTSSLMELYQALLELQAATGSESVAMDAAGLLEFVLVRLRQAEGFIPDQFEREWTAPKVIDRALSIELGDQLKWAYLISEGARLGRTRRHLRHGHALLDLAMEAGLDESGAAIGRYENRWLKGTWQQAEFMRAMLRYADLHGREELKSKIARLQDYIEQHCNDAANGGWVPSVQDGSGGERRIPISEAGMYMEAWRIKVSLEPK